MRRRTVATPALSFVRRHSVRCRGSFVSVAKATSERVAPLLVLKAMLVRDYPCAVVTVSAASLRPPTPPSARALPIISVPIAASIAPFPNVSLRHRFTAPNATPTRELVSACNQLVTVISKASSATLAPMGTGVPSAILCARVTGMASALGTRAFANATSTGYKGIGPERTVTPVHRDLWARRAPPEMLK